MRHPGDTQPHLDAAQRAGEHEVVEIAEMADAEDLVGEPAEAGAERHVETLEDGPAQPVGAVPLRHEDGGQRARILARLATQDLQPPGPDRAPRRLGVTIMAGGGNGPPPPPPRGEGPPAPPRRRR